MTVGGADNPVGSYWARYSLLLKTESEPVGIILIKDARRDLLLACIQVIEQELADGKEHIRTRDVLQSAYKVRKDNS